MTTTQERTRGTLPLVAIGAGAAVAVALGVYGAQHDPTGEEISTFGFDSMIAMKVWLAVAAGVLAVGQLVGALWLYGKLGIRAPSWLGMGHRAGGVLVVVLTLPVAYHCLWSLGYQSYDTRVLVHSIAGCAVYGALVTKVFAVHARTAPGWFLPLAGAVLFTVLVLAVLTSAGWYLNEFGNPSASPY